MGTNTEEQANIRYQWDHRYIPEKWNAGLELGNQYQWIDTWIAPLERVFAPSTLMFLVSLVPSRTFGMIDIGAEQSVDSFDVVNILTNHKPTSMI